MRVKHDHQLTTLLLISADFEPGRYAFWCHGHSGDGMVQEFRVQGVYEPKLKVRIKSDNGKVMIDIEDNVPGLRISISTYIVKAHGERIEVHVQ